MCKCFGSGTVSFFRVPRSQAGMLDVMAHVGPVRYTLLYINSPPGLSSSLLLGFLGSTIPARDFSLCMRGRILWPQSGSCQTWRNLVTCYKEFRFYVIILTYTSRLKTEVLHIVGTQQQHIRCVNRHELIWKCHGSQFASRCRNQHTCTLFSELNSLLLLFHLCGKGGRKREQGLSH